MLQILCLLCTLFLGPAGISMDRYSHDFGANTKDIGILECDFILSNDSDDTVLIENVSVECHCTSAEWSKDPIPVGGKSVVKIIYNREFYTDEFDRGATIHFSGMDETISLRIYGSFYDTKETLAKTFPILNGSIAAPLNDDCAPIVAGQRMNSIKEIANISDSAISLEFTDVQPGLKLSNFDESIDPVSRTKLWYIIDADTDALGYKEYSATPIVNGIALNPLVFSTFVYADYSQLSPEEKENAPFAMLASTSTSHAQVEKGAVYTDRIVFNNAGKSNLHFTSASSPCSAVSFVLPVEVSVRGYGVVSYSVDSSMLEAGTYLIKLFITTDSPAAPYFLHEISLTIV